MPVNVNIDDQSTNQHLTIKNTSPDFTSFYIDKCFYGASKACKTNPKKATFVTQKELPKGYGIMCDKKLSSQLVAMQVQIDSNPNMSTPIPITVYGSANCGNEDSQTVFKISWQDANRKDATRIETEGYYRPQIFPSLPPKEVYEKIVSLV